jgi:hypothetical protein
MADAILKQLDSWYRDPSQGGDRPKLLSKLATIELCGWIEGEFDRLINEAQKITINDSDWVKKNVVDSTYGFSYDEHFRKMLCRLFGEFLVRKIESSYENATQGNLDRLKSELGTLWKIRCSFAHADMAANIAAQQQFQAPSWSLNRYKIIRKLISEYEVCLKEVLDAET